MGGVRFNGVEQVVGGRVVDAQADGGKLADAELLGSCDPVLAVYEGAVDADDDRRTLVKDFGEPLDMVCVECSPDSMTASQISSGNLRDVAGQSLEVVHALTGAGPLIYDNRPPPGARHQLSKCHNREDGVCCLPDRPATEQSSGMHEPDTAPSPSLATPVERIRWWATHPDELLAALAEGDALAHDRLVTVLVEARSALVVSSESHP